MQPIFLTTAVSMQDLIERLEQEIKEEKMVLISRKDLKLSSRDTRKKKVPHFTKRG